MKQILKNKKAITLIALVITIVVLVILAGVIITLSIGNEGLISRAIKAANDYKNSKTKEEQGINDLYGELVVASDGTITMDATQLQKIINDSTKDLRDKVETQETTINNLNNQLTTLNNSLSLKNGTITKSNDVASFTINSFKYNAQYAKITGTVKLSSDLASGTSVTIGTIDNTDARPKNGLNVGLGYNSTRGFIGQVKVDGVITIRNIGSTTLTKNNEIYLTFFYPINM